jgi:hypothetical protein
LSGGHAGADGELADCTSHNSTGEMIFIAI